MLLERKEKIDKNDRRYRQEQDYYSSLSQVFEDFKQELNAKNGWNVPLVDVSGMTLKHVDTDKVVLTYHKIVIGTPEDVMRDDHNSKKCLDDIAREVKKRFKKKTKKTANLKLIKDGKSVEKHSRIYAENIPLYGGGVTYGRNMGRYYVAYSRMYQCEVT